MFSEPGRGDRTREPPDAFDRPRSTGATITPALGGHRPGARVHRTRPERASPGPCLVPPVLELPSGASVHGRTSSSNPSNPRCRSTARLSARYSTVAGCSAQARASRPHGWSTTTTVRQSAPGNSRRPVRAGRRRRRPPSYRRRTGDRRPVVRLSRRRPPRSGTRARIPPDGFTSLRSSRVVRILRPAFARRVRSSQNAPAGIRTGVRRARSLRSLCATDTVVRRPLPMIADPGRAVAGTSVRTTV